VTEIKQFEALIKSPDWIQYATSLPTLEQVMSMTTLDAPQVPSEREALFRGFQSRDPTNALFRYFSDESNRDHVKEHFLLCAYMCITIHTSRDACIPQCLARNIWLKTATWLRGVESMERRLRCAYWIMHHWLRGPLSAGLLASGLVFYTAARLLTMRSDSITQSSDSDWYADAMADTNTSFTIAMNRPGRKKAWRDASLHTRLLMAMQDYAFHCNDEYSWIASRVKDVCNADLTAAEKWSDGQMFYMCHKLNSATRGCNLVSLYDDFLKWMRGTEREDAVIDLAESRKTHQNRMPLEPYMLYTLFVHHTDACLHNEITNIYYLSRTPRGQETQVLEVERAKEAYRRGPVLPEDPLGADHEYQKNLRAMTQVTRNHHEFDVEQQLDRDARRRHKRREKHATKRARE